ncbi:MAG: SMC-Scp complex subunit ScpB [Candidatus Schekmanbacteria bacterium RIFCSPHIGHO2_02_FULL_38_11]|uniref:SMC-Scp complex subunit ScpB n=1 Tax=Candidatus Schekmanbacteria bacterium RIFCSPLOWO2_12_FULL_38_15 TaxID=1817883 RepID=A0A1F7SMX3_9BACT|nr:MAG: SMC-Scp complex subunit ScpB [Candidatus Schekmanbacteria bacterium GWA2_38_9]OGL47958.1 MAG: SMC-Scp complex subunit ScpB [Candidatus Schekmanbacteria bacterium RIFCSPLOWO2_02_FULL_38_14]OGL49025.1 MAG: SMC-Scp complex subunit ScpB [Candidatus Schekmanbacteria bacterium RIFCSPHIGHO2_02_FULL_38_11]OGL54557.1 MAG: SMC-Scp complex subunit ScpB [Candidatus Schekmanbacteria bacterium RIFCSPLOWO2_12_FULL_38_15]
MGEEITFDKIKAIAEALIFVSDIPLSINKINEVLDKTDVATIKTAILQLQDEYEKGGKGIQIIEVANGYKMCTRSEYSDYVTKLFTHRKKAKLSAQALETLAVIAYKQPVTKPEIEEIRGVNIIGVLKTLLDRNMIKILGKKDAVGRPILYGTTREFLEYFGLKDLTDLPTLKDFSEFDLGEIKNETEKLSENTKSDVPNGDIVEETVREDDGGRADNS